MPGYLYGLLFLLSLIWGTSFLFIKVLLESFTPGMIALLRCLLGASILLIIMAIKREKFIGRNAPWGKMFLVSLLNNTLPWTLIAFSETRLSSGLASVLNATTSLWTIVVGILVFGVVSGLNQWIGIILGFLGILVLTDIDWSTFTISDPIGFGAMLLATLLYAFAGQISKKFFKELTAYQTAFGTLAIGSISAAVVAFFSGSMDFSPLLDLHVLGAMIGLGVFGSGIAYIIYYTLIGKGTAEFAALVTYLVPPFAVLWGAIFLHEKLSLSMLIGSLLILAGVYISGKRKKQLKGIALPSEQKA